jgi:hypothetical protein
MSWECHCVHVMFMTTRCKVRKGGDEFLGTMAIPNDFDGYKYNLRLSNRTQLQWQQLSTFVHFK